MKTANEKRVCHTTSLTNDVCHWRLPTQPCASATTVYANMAPTIARLRGGHPGECVVVVVVVGVVVVGVIVVVVVVIRSTN